MEAKNQLFQRLKRDCIALAQASASYKSGRVDQKSIIERLEKLNGTLLSTTSPIENAFDAKLAEYVFFPIAQLLRESQGLSIRCLEICMQCVATLIDQGWKRDLPPKLAAQLVILCSSLGERSPKGLSFSESTDELQSRSFWCLHHVFTEIAKTDVSRKTLTDESSFPQLGQTISGLLDGIQNGRSAEPQIAATAALNALVVSVIDAEIQANFLPGLVSRLTKILTPQSRQRRHHKVLVGCLNTLEVLLENSMGCAQRSPNSNGITSSLRQKSIMDEQWKEAAASQIKPAFSSICRLKSHARDNVKESLATLCLSLLRYCRETLSNCSEIAVEALVTIVTTEADSTVTFDFRSLLHSDRSLTGLLQGMLYDRLQRLAIIMQDHDEDAKESAIAHIATSYTLLAGIEADMTTIDRTLITALRDSAVVTLNEGSRRQHIASKASPVHAMDLDVLKANVKVQHSGLSLVRSRGQEVSLDRLASIAKLVVSRNASSSLTAGLARDLRYSTGDVQTANLWLLLSTVAVAVETSQTTDIFLHTGIGGYASTAYNESLEELYSFSLSVLTDTSDETKDTRLLSLALHGLALRAQTAGQDFRYELVDALYPVLHTLATPNNQLQRDSVSTLEAFTSACGYASTRDLIVENVDYLTNAVALKLNAFDVSPQAPQVLLMMVRLAGSSLLPYLEDTVESIFAALEDYHGYPLLVELLFKVLSALAEEGAKTPHLAIAPPEGEQHSPLHGQRWQPTSVEGLVALLHEDTDEEEELPSDEPQERHPRRPWKAAQDDPREPDDEEEALDMYQDQQVDEADLPPPVPKTYGLLLKITELTQHFLPSASPSLRTSLLALIKTTVPAVSRHENSFLPLINTLWPEIVARLDDEEPYAVASAIDVVGILCQHAENFMRTRIDQVWSRLVELSQGSVDRSFSGLLSRELRSGQKQHDSAMFLDLSHHQDTKSLTSPLHATSNTSSRMIGEALVSTLTRIIRFMQVSPEMFDEALVVLEPALEQAAVRSTLLERNADAVWLAEVTCGRVSRPSPPSTPKDRAWAFAQLPRR